MPDSKHHDPSAVFAESLVERVSNVPVRYLEQLSFKRTMIPIRRILHTDARLAVSAERISDDLYEVIGKPENLHLKPRLVALRRAVHGGRIPDERTLGPDILEALPIEVKLLLKGWQEDLDHRRADAAALPGIFHAEIEEKYRSLRDAVQLPAFQQGLVQGSPSLFERMLAWLDAEPGAMPERKVALRLAKYLSRVVAKTSPYSTFTASGVMPIESLGVDDKVGRGVDTQPEHSWQTRLELNTWVEDRIHQRSLSSTASDDGRLIRVNPTVTIVRDHVVFIMTTSHGESIQTLHAAKPLVRVLEFFTEFRQQRASDLIDYLTSDDTSYESARSFVRQVISVGLLESFPLLEDQSHDYTFGTGLCTNNDQSEKVFNSVYKPMAAYPHIDDARSRSKQLEEIHQSLRERFADLGYDPSVLPSKNAVHETAVLTGRATQPDISVWRDVQGDLDAVRKFSALFRHDLPFKLACSQFFDEHYTSEREVPFVAFYRDAIKHMSNPEGEGSELAAHLSGPFGAGWDLKRSSVPTIRKLDQMRDEAQSKILAHSPGHEGIQLDRQLLDHESSSWPEFVRPPESVSFYLQLSPKENGTATNPTVVMNECSIGYGRARRRLDGLRYGDYGTVSPPPQYQHRDVILAECDANFGHRLNVRSPATEHCVDYPGAFSVRPDKLRLSLSDLLVRKNSDTGELVLWSPHFDAPIRPLHLGLLGDFLLPSTFAFLIKGFGEPPSLIYQSWSPFVNMSLWNGGKEPEGIVETPRISVGNLVVARKTFSIHASEFPRIRKGEDEVQHLLRLGSWLLEHNIPHRCFIRVLSSDWLAGRGTALSKSRKPMFVDFSSIFLVTSLERSIASPNDLLVIQEALPDPHDAPFEGQEQYVKEYVVELNDGEAIV